MCLKGMNMSASSAVQGRRTAVMLGQDTSLRVSCHIVLVLVFFFLVSFTCLQDNDVRILESKNFQDLDYLYTVINKGKTCTISENGHLKQKLLYLGYHDSIPYPPPPPPSTT